MKDTNVLTIQDDIPQMKEKLYYEGLPLKKIIFDLEDTSAKVKIIILDACRDNPLEASTTRGTRSLVGASGGLGSVKAPSGMLISYSADVGQQANDGLFTAVLARHMQTPGSAIHHVFAKTREEVRAKALELQLAGKGKLHEPAEYTKLSSQAQFFSFSPTENQLSSSTVSEMPYPPQDGQSPHSPALGISTLPHNTSQSHLLLIIVAIVAVFMTAFALIQYRKASLQLRSVGSADIDESKGRSNNPQTRLPDNQEPAPHPISPDSNSQLLDASESTDTALNRASLYDSGSQSKEPVVQNTAHPKYDVGFASTVEEDNSHTKVSARSGTAIMSTLYVTLTCGVIAAVFLYLTLSSLGITQPHTVQGGDIWKAVLTLGIAAIWLFSIGSAWNKPTPFRTFFLKWVLRGSLALALPAILILTYASIKDTLNLAPISFGAIVIQFDFDSVVFAFIGIGWVVFAVVFSNFLFEYDKYAKTLSDR